MQEFDKESEPALPIVDPSRSDLDLSNVQVFQYSVHYAWFCIFWPIGCYIYLFMLGSDLCFVISQL
jgi:hypothetical protein